MQRKTPLRRKTWIKRVSRKGVTRRKMWLALKAMLLKLRPRCEATLMSTGERCKCKAVDVHHKRGRYGKWLLYIPFLMCVCRYCHDRIHRYGKWARAMGYIVD